MHLRFLCTAAALVVGPSVALAAEPSKGTVITIASIGGWVIVSSLGILLRRKREERAKRDDAAVGIDKNA